MNIQSALQVFDSGMAKNFREIAAFPSCHAEATVYIQSKQSFFPALCNIENCVLHECKKQERVV